MLPYLVIYLVAVVVYLPRRQNGNDINVFGLSAENHGELEVLEQEGFGKLIRIRSNGVERLIFFKISGTMVDTEIRNHTAILKLAEMSLDQYANVFIDMRKTNRSILMKHPYIEEFRDSLEDI